jgi:TPR repeat protein
MVDDFQNVVDLYKQGDYKATLEECKPLSGQGDSLVQGLLGVLYSRDHDYQEAMKWFGLSAEQGNVFAKHEIKKIKISPMFKGKLLFICYPEQFAPVYSFRH